MKLYQAIAQQLNRIANCENMPHMDESLRVSNQNDARDTIEYLCKNSLPHGSGFDAGVTFDFDASKESKLVFRTSFHRMDENGYYAGWSDYTIIVKPSLAFDFDMRTIGSNRGDLRSYVADCFRHALNKECRYTMPDERQRAGSSIVELAP